MKRALNLTKEDFRRDAKRILKKEVQISARAKHYKMFKPLLNLLTELKAKRILIFNPLSYEPNFYILKRELAKKYEIFAPFMLGKIQATACISDKIWRKRAAKHQGI